MIPMSTSRTKGEGMQDGLEEADVEVTSGLIPGVAVGATECTGGDAGVSAGVSAEANDDLEADKNQGEEKYLLLVIN